MFFVLFIPSRINRLLSNKNVTQRFFSVSFKRSRYSLPHNVYDVLTFSFNIVLSYTIATPLNFAITWHFDWDLITVLLLCWNRIHFKSLCHDKSNWYTLNSIFFYHWDLLLCILLCDLHLLTCKLEKVKCLLFCSENFHITSMESCYVQFSAVFISWICVLNWSDECVFWSFVSYSMTW